MKYKIYYTQNGSGSITDKVNKFVYYEECNKLVRKYEKYIKQKDILDIGSNIGLFSKAIVNNYEYNSIHLFEPSKEYFDYSKSLLKVNKNIYFNNFGLGDVVEEKKLFKSSDNNIGWNTFLTKDPNQETNFTQKMNFEISEIKKLDDYNVDNIDFIKIDVEGYECKVLNGGMNFIAKHKPYILIEVGWGKNHPEWPYCENQYNKLFKLGYKKVNFKNYTQDILFEPI